MVCQGLPFVQFENDNLPGCHSVSPVGVSPQSGRSVPAVRLAYASWCRQHTLQMRQVDDLAFEDARLTCQKLGFDAVVLVVFVMFLLLLLLLLLLSLSPSFFGMGGRCLSFVCFGGVCRFSLGTASQQENIQFFYFAPFKASTRKPLSPARSQLLSRGRISPKF